MSRTFRTALLACALGALAALSAPAPAPAFYGNAVSGGPGADLISADYARLEQGDDSTVYAAISADGRYVAIQTRARNFFADNDPDPPGEYRAGGIFRFDLQTRALEKVADGDLFKESDDSFLRRGASNPSISADGRYVAFATGEGLVPADTNGNVDVYVRDMTIPIGSPGAYELVSARDGGDVPASYGPPPVPFPGSNPGADVSRGASISADGRRVVFRTEAESNLPASGSIDVPAGQVFLRNLATKTTTLVTRTDPGGQPAGGALGAVLSADGTTVAWTGGNAAAQTRFLGGENPDPTFFYYLWRRVADGPGATTRRVTGLADPDDPACPPGANTSFDQISTGPCYGPLTDQEGNRGSIASQLPALSGDGYTVAFLTGSGPRPLPFTGAGLDLFVTDMTPGLSRKQATIELTRDPPSNDPAASPPLSSVAMSPDVHGRYVAVTTARTQFTLPALQLLGAPRAVPGISELYIVDLASRTIERVTHAYDGTDINGDVQDGPTLSADGSRVAFTSFAGDFFYGDANQRPDAFVATRQADPATEGPLGSGEDTGPAASIEVDPDGPRIAAHAKRGRGGAVALTVSVPEAGKVKALARARVGSPPKLRTLASAAARSPGRGTVHLVLRPAPRYRSELEREGRIRARVRVSLVPSSGGRSLGTSLQVTFHGR